MGYRHRSRLLVAGSALAAGIGLHTGAWAQPMDASATDDGEIIVTAQKRTQKLRDVPASVGVVTGAELEHINSTSLADYASYIPGLSVNSSGAPGRQSVVIRGISAGGSGSSIGALVGTYVDDVPVGATPRAARPTGFSLDLFPYDLDHIEVLRGPQGTLYGASTMGGLLKYTLKSADPNKQEAVVGTTLENTESTSALNFGVRGAVNAPIVDGQFAVRLSGFYQKSAGWVDNVTLGASNTNRAIQKGGRLAVAWLPTPDLTIKASALFQDTKSDGAAAILVDSATIKPIVDRYTNSSAMSEPSRAKLQNYALTINWEQPFANILSATSYSVSDNTSTVDLSALYAYFGFIPADGLSPFSIDVHVKKFTQEVRVASPTGETLEWQIGGFYTHEDVLVGQRVGALDATGAGIPGLDPLVLARWPYKYEEVAGFADVTWNISSAWNLSGGLRYSHNSQSYQLDQSGALYAAPTSLVGSASDNVLTWSLSSLYRLDSRNNIYGRIATGYRPGGANSTLFGVPPSYDADTLTSYEVGYKGSLLDNKLRINLALFYIDWKDIQISLVTPANTGYIGNGGKARSKGVEFEGTYEVLPGFKATATTAYTDATLREDVPSLFGLKGDQLPESPKWTASIRADYEYVANDGLSWSAGAAYRFRDKVYSAVTSDTSAQVIPAQNIVDLYAAINISRYSVRAYVRNLTNKTVFSNLYFPDFGGVSQYSVGNPRTIGVALDVKF